MLDIFSEAEANARWGSMMLGSALPTGLLLSSSTCTALTYTLNPHPRTMDNRGGYNNGRGGETSAQRPRCPGRGNPAHIKWHRQTEFHPFTAPFHNCAQGVHRWPQLYIYSLDERPIAPNKGGIIHNWNFGWPGPHSFSSLEVCCAVSRRSRQCQH